jgi:methionine aminopeptidase
VNVDVTLYLDGFHADTARSWICGEGDETGHRDLVSMTFNQIKRDGELEYED